MGDVFIAVGEVLFELTIRRLQVYFYGDDTKSVPHHRKYFLWGMLMMLAGYFAIGFYSWFFGWQNGIQFYPEVIVVSIFLITFIFFGVYISAEYQRKNKLRVYISSLAFLSAVVVGIYIATI